MHMYVYVYVCLFVNGVIPLGLTMISSRTIAKWLAKISVFGTRNFLLTGWSG